VPALKVPKDKIIQTAMYAGDNSVLRENIGIT
jgi:hypothetical protein